MSSRGEAEREWWKVWALFLFWKVVDENCEGVKLMNWLDNYIIKNENGYLINDNGGLFVEIDHEYVRHVKGDNEPVDLKEITKDDFIEKLIK